MKAATLASATLDLGSHLVTLRVDINLQLGKALIIDL